MSHVFHILSSRIDSVELAIVDITNKLLFFVNREHVRLVMMMQYMSNVQDAQYMSDVQDAQYVL